jgi:UDP-glucose 4-epimerase
VTITGAAGRIGSVVTRALVEAGHDVVATDLKTRDDLPVPVRDANLLDEGAIPPLVDGADAVVHLGNHPGIGRRSGRSAQRTYAENVAMNANVFEAALAADVKLFVFASSVQATGGGRNRGEFDPGSFLPYLPMDGRAPARPGNMYALSKEGGERMLEYYARRHGRTCVAIRFPLMIDRAKRPDTPIEREYPKLDETFAYLDVRDGAALVVAILAAPLSGYRAYFPASRGNLENRAVPALIRAYYPNVPLRRPIDAIESLVDTSDIERETGWKPTIV